MENKKFVRIQSTITIRVTAGLQNKDVTNPDAHIADRLKVSAEWPKATVLINQGVGVYPSEVVDWPTVKALQNDKILTIGEFLDDADDETTQKKDELVRNLDAINKESKRTRRSKATLESMTEEDETHGE